MATPVKEIIEWLQGLAPDSCVGVDDGGLALVELDAANDEETGAYFEIGGVPSDGPQRLEA